VDIGGSIRFYRLVDSGDGLVETPALWHPRISSLPSTGTLVVRVRKCPSVHAGSAELVFKRRRTDGSISFSAYRRYLQTRHRSVMTAGTRRRLVMQLRWYTAHLQARIRIQGGRSEHSVILVRGQMLLRLRGG
jgi:hypothetical protein